jgi:hypothetical protein
MTLRTIRTRSFALLLGVLLVFAGNAFAQSSNGSIVGTVTDKTGGAVANASIKVVSIDRGGETHNATTDSSGTYRLSSLLPGRYRVTIEASGFASTVINDLDVRGSLETTASAVLEISSAVSTITVEASAGQELQTQSGEISANISTTEVINLPYFSGNPIELLLTEPGVQDVAARDSLTNGIGMSVNGTRPRANNFLIDGQDNNDSQIAGQAVQTINHEAIGEVTILTNSASAEFGRGGGSVTNEIFKGGTNDWHGSGWDIIQPSKLAAIPADLALGGVTRNPVQITNTFGFSVGGPIKKNKLFFFATPQWNRFRANAGANAHVLSLPTANGVAALKQIETNEGDNANIDYLLAALGNLRGGSTGIQTISAGVNPNATGPARPSIEFGNLLRGDTSIVSNDLQWSFRVDYQVSDHDQLTARFFRDSSTLTPDFFNNPGELPSFETQQGGPSSNFHAAWTHTINPHMLNELRFSYATINFAFSPTPATLASPIGTHFTVVFNDISNPDTSNTLFGLPGNEPASRDHQTYQFQDSFSWSLGKHTVKFGGDVALVSIKDGIPVDTRGTFTVFRGGTCGTITCSGLANYIDNFSGKGGTVSRFFGSSTIQPFAPNYAPFVEDTWRVKQNFTLDLGLRYEYWGTPENSLQFPALAANIRSGLAGATFPGSFGAQEIPDKNNFAPRVGLAYTPRVWNRFFGGDKTVFRAGYGIFYDGLFTNILDNTAGGSPNGVLQTQVGGGGATGRGFANATGVLLGLQPTQSQTSNVFTIAANLRNPLTHQWNLDIQRSLPGGIIMTAAYVGTRGEHLFVNQDFNPGVGTDANGNQLFTNPNFGFVSARTNGGDSIFHSGQLKVERPFSHGMLIRGSYTYSKFIDDMSEVFVTSGGSSRAQDLSNQHGDRGLSAFDRRHRLAIAYLYELPHFHNHDGAFMSAMNAVIGGWQTSGTLSFTSGAPETLHVGFDANGDGYGGNDRPSLANSAVPINYSAACLVATGFCNSGVGFSADGVHFVDFNSSFGSDAMGNFIATRNQFHYVVVLGQNGNVGRNTFISPGTINTNLSVQKIVKLKEHYAFTLRGDFFNAFNHPNLGIPNLTLTSGTAFQNEARTINGGRIIVLWGKFSF